MENWGKTMRTGIWILCLIAVALPLLAACGGGGRGLEDPPEDPGPVAPAPIAKAGPDRIGASARDFANPDVTEMVFLNGSGSSGAVFAWVLTSQTVPGDAGFTSPNTVVTGFYADKAGEYTLTLQVGNGQGVVDTDTLVVTLIDDLDLDGLEDGQDPDQDGDGFLPPDDRFPTDRASHYDADEDGTSNCFTLDVDADATPDTTDDFPLDPTRSAYDTYAETKEPGNSNGNDGVSVSESAGSVPKRITGSIDATSGRPDIDFFAIDFDTPGRYSIVLTGSTAAMRPTISLLNPQGTGAVDATAANLVDIAGSTSLSVYVPTVDTYYLIVTDATGRSDPTWTYTTTLFPDGDLDGLPDDLEAALDCSHLTADSDGDGIPDSAEVRAALDDWNLYWDGDNDGLPVWWDLDADGDTIRDRLEFSTVAALNDADGDGTPNYLDIDSDGNGVSDADEVGMDPTRPADLDLDGIPDYRDLDDDGDGLLDVNEDSTQRTVPLAMSSTMRLTAFVNDTVDVENVARDGDAVRLEGADLPWDAGTTWIVIRGPHGTLNLHPDAIDEAGVHLTWPAGITPGVVEVFVATGQERTTGIGVLVPAGDAPVLTNVFADAATGLAYFAGLNLDQSLTVHFTGVDQPRDNTGGSPTDLAVGVPAGAQQGHVYVSSATGASNPLWVDLPRLLQGEVGPPAGSAVDVTTLDVSWSLTDGAEVNPAGDGSFITTVSLTEVTVVTALLERAASTEESPSYVVFLEAVALPEDTFVTVDAAATAVALAWSAVGVDALVAPESLGAARDRIAALTSVQDLGALLATKLAADPEVLAAGDAQLEAASQQAAQDAAQAIDDALLDGSLTPLLKRTLLRLAALNDATVTPEELDDIKVYEREGTGNLNLENDTQLYLSVKITASDGTVLQPHATNLSGMAGPQGGGLLFWASTTKYDQPGGRNCTVEVITPGGDSEFDPASPSSLTVWQGLKLRTIVERVVWPPVSQVLSLPLSGDVFAQVVVSNLPNLSTIQVLLANGEYGAAAKAIVDVFWSDLASLPPGPITQALAKKLGKNWAQKALAKLAAKIGAKFVPGVGQIALAFEIAGWVNTGANTAKAIQDLITTDAALEFEVEFALVIDEVVPSKILPDGTDREFTIKGSGFAEIEKGSLWWKQTFTPDVAFTTPTGDSWKVTPTISADGKEMKVTLPGAFIQLIDDDTLNVEVHHPTDVPGAKADLSPAVEIVQEVEISSIDPNKGGAGNAVTVHGAGFSHIITDNEVRVGGSAALLSSASESALEIAIPASLIPGTYGVEARSRYDGTWSDWSNTVDFEVVAGSVEVQVWDNGGAKDDAFALFVDSIYRGTMYASPGDYSDTYALTLTPGTHTAMLLGVEAPDSIGTYAISFTGVTNLTGDATSGSDLVPGVQKHYQFVVPDPSTPTKPAPALVSFPYAPSRSDPESGR